MANDRRTTIDGDQITDGTITPDEFESTNSPVDGNLLTWDGTSQKMEWKDITGGAGDIEIQKDDNSIATGVNIINFEGRVKVINEGSGTAKATIKIIKRGRIII